jgi:BMFP domain-containing protein YqiC
MMQKDNPLFDDLTRLMTGIAGTMAGAGREAEQRFREKMREMVAGEGFVSREEFDAVKEMAATARAEVEALKAEVAALRSGGA